MKNMVNPPDGYFTLRGSLDLFSEDILNEAVEIEAMSDILAREERSKEAQEKVDSLRLIHVLISEHKGNKIINLEIKEKIKKIKEKFSNKIKKPA